MSMTFKHTYFRFWPVFLRNLLVWRKLAIPSLVANIAEPLMWLVAFGYGMGALVGEVTLDDQKVPYILFLASGSICMSAMNAATFEALYSAFSRMHVQKTWDGILNAPMRLDDVLLAEMLWAAHHTKLEALGRVAHLAVRGHHLQLHRTHLQCAGQRL
ncbi:MAG: hypothetical protein RL707_688 [Pseudomonadota bacterium]